MWSCFLLFLLPTSLPDMLTMNKFTTKVTHSMNSDQKSSFMIGSFMTSDQKSSFIIRSLMTSDQKSPFRLRSFMTSDQAKSRIGKTLMTSKRWISLFNLLLSSYYIHPPVWTHFFFTPFLSSLGKMDCNDIRHMQLLTLAGGLLGVLIRFCRVTSHVFWLFCLPTICVLLFALFGSVIYNPSLVSSFPLRCVLLRCTVDRPSLPDLAAACGQKPDRKKREVCPLLSCSNVLVRSMSILFFPFVGKQT